MAFDVSAPKGKVRPSMNVTPLVDVVLVLLIIFMVITPILTKQFSVHVPPKEKENAPPPLPDALGPVVLRVDAQGVLFINREQIERERLVEKVSRAMAARSERVLFFDAADDCPYGVAMETLDLAREAGGVTIAVLPEKLSDS